MHGFSQGVKIVIFLDFHYEEANSFDTDYFINKNSLDRGTFHKSVGMSLQSATTPRILTLIKCS